MNPFMPPGFEDAQPDYSQVDKEFEVYQQGRLLRSVVHTPAWEIVIDTLKSYVDKYKDALMGFPIGDSGVLTAHAAAAVLEDVFYKFQQDIQNAIRMADKPSPELADYLNGVIENSDVLKAQG